MLPKGKAKYLNFLLPVLALGSLFSYMTTGCSASNDETAISTQITNIETFVSRFQDSLTVDRVGDTFFVIASNDYPPSVTPVDIEEGDHAFFYYEGYAFSATATGGKDGIFVTNRAELNAQLGLTPGGAPDEIFDAEVGVTPLVGRLSEILTYCHLGDSVMIYMPFHEAYGNRDFGIIPKNTPITFVLKIEDVVK